MTVWLRNMSSNFQLLLLLGIVCHLCTFINSKFYTTIDLILWIYLSISDTYVWLAGLVMMQFVPSANTFWQNWQLALLDYVPSYKHWPSPDRCSTLYIHYLIGTWYDMMKISHCERMIQENRVLMICFFIWPLKMDLSPNYLTQTSHLFSGNSVVICSFVY